MMFTTSQLTTNPKKLIIRNVLKINLIIVLKELFNYKMPKCYKHCLSALKKKF